jgi:hypothetical protein
MCTRGVTGKDEGLSSSLTSPASQLVFEAAPTITNKARVDTIRSSPVTRLHEQTPLQESSAKLSDLAERSGARYGATRSQTQ